MTPTPVDAPVTKEWTMRTTRTTLAASAALAAAAWAASVAYLRGTDARL